MSVLDLFNGQVRLTPERVAAVCGVQHLTFQELERQARALALELSDAGVRRGDVVALSLDRSLECVIATLAVRKMECGHVFIEPSAPRERRAEILGDAAASAVISISEEGRLEATAAETPPWSRRWCEPRPIFGVVYTSGSTGRPKGVLVSERVVLNRLKWFWDLYAVTAEDVAIMHRSCALVSLPLELFGPLLKGVRLVLVPAQEASNVRRLIECFIDHQVTITRETPASSAALLEQCRTSDTVLTGIRAIRIGGDTVSWSLLEQWRGTCPRARLIVTYGLTECSVTASYVADPQGHAHGRVPAGEPAPGVRAYVLDERLEHVSEDSVGEIYVAGASLSRGYLNDVRSQCSTFVADPFGPPGSVMCRTGDVGVWRSGPVLEIIGRRDRRVKVRGFRVELDEVEAALLGCAGVEGAVAVADTLADGVTVVAYVATAGRSAQVADIRAEIARRLPSYMIPGRIIPVSVIPLTRSGKPDRLAVPSYAIAPAALSQPRYLSSDTERSLAGLWQAILGLTSDVGPQQTFIELGGHSLSAMRAIGRIRDRYGVDLDPGDLLGTKDLRQIAADIDADSAAAGLDIAARGVARVPSQ